MDIELLEKILEAESSLSGNKINKITPVNGGCIHDAWNLELNSGEKLFAKTTSLENSEMFEVEAIGLDALNKYANKLFLYIPKPIMLQKLNNHSILLMPWINFTQGPILNLGKGLALLHKVSAEKNKGYFGWDSNGFIGSGPQPKAWETSWGECFVTFRLLPQLELARKWGFIIKGEETLLSKISSFLDQHDPKPSLVHGDLWKGNTGIDQDGRGVIFDPACWWADREVDLAMTKLFGGFSNDFYAAYERIWPMPIEWERRIDIYNLYHMINHGNIFGGSYQHQCFEYIERIRLLLT